MYCEVEDMKMETERTYLRDVGLNKKIMLRWTTHAQKRGFLNGKEIR